jgi:hypothetical protein
MLASRLPQRVCIVRSIVCSQPSVHYGYMLVEIDSKFGLIGLIGHRSWVIYLYVS